MGLMADPAGKVGAPMDPRAGLRRLFGFDDFRPGQAEAVDAAMAGRDVLVVMPTGSGKSLCYQLPALLRDDLTVVVSPLVSLMQDQVDGLRAVAPDAVALVNAQEDPAANRAAVTRAAAGELRLLYVAPERFSSPGFVEALRRARVGLFVVDEAHCVSQWGHDFRPDYFRLADAARYLGADALVASTATATTQVAGDVARRLGLRDPVRISTGFDRPNLSFAVVRCRTRESKHAQIAAALAEPEALPAIVYAGTRAGCEALAPRLGAALGVEALVYHAGLRREERAEAQRRFMGGDVPLVVATNAFGMGVDKADVRTVCHETVPQSVEALYQEAGRAGRDGRPARCLLFAEPRDKGLHVFFIERARVDDDAFGRVAARLAEAASEEAAGELSGPEGPLAGARYNLPLRELQGTNKKDEDAIRSVLGHLVRAGVIQPSPAPPDRASGRLVSAFDGKALALCRSAANEAERARWRQYRAIWSFVEQSSCRRRAILRHFGDNTDPEPTVPCCDTCAPEIVAAVLPAGRAGAGRGARRDRPEAGRRPPAAPVPARQGGRGPAITSPPESIEQAIIEIVQQAEPGVGRTRAVEILRGGRSKVIQKHSYDGLPPYGTFSHLSSGEVLERVDAMLAEGRLRSTGGRFPKLAAAG